MPSARFTAAKKQRCHQAFRVRYNFFVKANLQGTQVRVEVADRLERQVQPRLNDLPADRVLAETKVVGDLNQATADGTAQLGNTSANATQASTENTVLWSKLKGRP